MTQRPTLDVDPFGDQAIRDPFPVERAIRDTASAVWLERHGVWALGRFGDVRRALRADEVLVSSRGVGLNDLVNRQPRTNTLMSDGDRHRQLRRVLMRPMMPRPLTEVKRTLESLARDLVEDLLARDGFDGIVDFSRHLPVSVVSHLVGLPEEGRERMLDWAQAGFNALGPMNERATAGGPGLLEMIQYAASVKRSQLRPEGWAAGVFDAVDGGELDAEDAPGLLIDYIAPSLDTTILGTGHMLYLLGTHPEQYAALRRNPTRVPAAVHEALRLGSPVRAFTRVAARPYETETVAIPEGERVLLLYGAANRDERHYPEPYRFDLAREARDHLAFGYGVHRCAGGHLAQLEMESLLHALVARVEHIEVGEPTPLMSNMLHGYASFPASFR